MGQKKHKLPLIGGIMAAIAGSICCIGPLILLLLGVSGAWIGSLTLLEPYRPLFVIAVMILFSWSAWKLYRPKIKFSAAMPCICHAVPIRQQITFWIVAIIAVILMTSNYWMLWFF